MAHKHLTMNQETLPVISIITIVLNGNDSLESTITSVINQTYPNIEYIVVDGGSTDGTRNIIKKYEKHISKWISEKDDGIYDAMNKGLRMATGRYVWFMNSGDEIYDMHTLSTIITQKEDVDVYYGDAIFKNPQGQLVRWRGLLPKHLHWKDLAWGMIVSHQAFIAKRSISPSFSTTYRIASDVEWTLRVLRQSKKVVNTKLILTVVLENGISTTQSKLGNKETRAILRENFGIFRITVFRILIILATFCRTYIPLGFTLLEYGASVVGLSVYTDARKNKKYSQQGEDAFLVRYFKKNPPIHKVFCDIGAYDGVTFSNTRLLALQGWTGTAVEPYPTSYIRLQKTYTSTTITTLQVAVGNTQKRGNTATLWYPNTNDEDTMLATCIPTEKERWPKLQDWKHMTVPLKTLREILNTMHTPPAFLSIDCEGMDLEVLESADFKKGGTLPQLIMLEHNKNRNRALEKAEALLSPLGYRRVFKSKLNAAWEKRP